MMMKNLIVSIALLSGSYAAQAQILTTQPGPANGQDAEIRTMDGGCQTAGSPLPDHFMNFGNEPYMSITDWTWNAGGCSGGTLRSLIRFDELSLIPAGAIIINAKLTLSHPPSNVAYWGNNYFPGTPLPNTNPGSVYLVDRSPAGFWLESSVNWWNAPGFEPALSAPIPVTTTQWNGSVSVDVTNLVQEIMNGGGINNGFYLKLDNEVHYRSQVYATSEYPDAALRPILVVEYKVYCDPSFSYCMNTNNPYSINFMANNLSYGYYEWSVDGSYAGNGPALSYNFPGPGSYEVCLTTVGDDGEKCSKCIKICLNDNGKMAIVKEQAAVTTGFTQVAKADNPVSDLNKSLLITPNPANDRISLRAPFEMYQVSIKSSFGFMVMDTKYDGRKAVELSISKLQAGSYIIEVSNKAGQVTREKFTKL